MKGERRMSWHTVKVSIRKKIKKDRENKTSIRINCVL